MKQRKEKQLGGGGASWLVEEPAVLYGSAAASVEGGASLLERVREGLPWGEFRALQGLLGLTPEELARLLGISRSTMLRRKRAGRLDTSESDRVVRLARLFSQACEILGGEEVARQWLTQPARGLGHVPPLELAETETGAREVENLLGRLAYGVYT